MKIYVSPKISVTELLESDLLYVASVDEPEDLGSDIDWGDDFA